MERKDIDREIGFVAKYYKAGLFNTDKALRKFKFTSRNIWSWPRIAVASCLVAVLSATAALLIRSTYYSEKPIEIENTQSPVKPVEVISRVIDFDDTPLPFVIDQIDLVYDVKIVNVPANAEDYRLSLHFEGNVIDLVDSINEILGLNLEIEK